MRAHRKAHTTPAGGQLERRLAHIEQEIQAASAELTHMAADENISDALISDRMQEVMQLQKWRTAIRGEFIA